MTNKELLLSYINTLPEKDCKRLYLILKDEVDNQGDWCYFNCYGERVNSPLGATVMLTPRQVNLLLNLWGTKKTKDIIALQVR